MNNNIKNNIINEVLRNTLIERMKQAIFRNYSNGFFCNIPEKLYEKVNKFDNMKIEKLKELFETFTMPHQKVPDGLYNHEDEKECKRLVEILKIAVSDGKKFEFPNYKKYNLSEEDKKFIEANSYSMSNEKMEHIVIDDVEATRQVLKEIYKLLGISPQNDIGNESEVELIENIYKNLFEIYNNMNNSNNLEQIQEYFEELDKRYIAGKYLGYFTVEIKKINETVGEVIREQYKNFDKDNIKKFPDSVDVFEREYNILLDIIDILDQNGTLKELIDKENRIINYMNKYLPSSKIDNIEYKSFMEHITNLDMNKKEDLIEMLENKRFFANKLAHCMDAYLYSYLYYSDKIKENRF